MGYYTESHFKFTLKKDTPEKIIDLLDKLFNDQSEFYASLLPENSYLAKALRSGGSYMSSVADTPNLPIDDSFGKCKRWDQFIRGSFNKLSRRVILNSEIKAYDCEYLRFLNWLKPYIVQSRRKKGTYLGWTKGEDQTNQWHHHLETLDTPWEI